MAEDAREIKVEEMNKMKAAEEILLKTTFAQAKPFRQQGKYYYIPGAGEQWRIQDTSSLHWNQRTAIERSEGTNFSFDIWAWVRKKHIIHGRERAKFSAQSSSFITSVLL